MKLIVMAAFWTLLLIHGFFDKGWKLCFMMSAIWLAGLFLLPTVEGGFVYFIALQGFMCLILMAKTGLTRIG